MPDLQTPPPDDPQGAPPAGLAGLTAREADLLREAGDRVFTLSRDLAEAARATDQLRADLASALNGRAESAAARDAQELRAESLQAQLGRAIEERDELRQLIKSLDHRLNQALAIAARSQAPLQPIGRSGLAARVSAARKALFPPDGGP